MPGNSQRTISNFNIPTVAEQAEVGTQRKPLQSFFSESTSLSQKKRNGFKALKTRDYDRSNITTEAIKNDLNDIKQKLTNLSELLPDRNNNERAIIATILTTHKLITNLLQARLFLEVTEEQPNNSAIATILGLRNNRSNQYEQRPLHIQAVEEDGVLPEKLTNINTLLDHIRNMDILLRELGADLYQRQSYINHYMTLVKDFQFDATTCEHLSTKYERNNPLPKKASLQEAQAWYANHPLKVTPTELSQITRTTQYINNKLNDCLVADDTQRLAPLRMIQRLRRHGRTESSISPRQPVTNSSRRGRNR